LVANILTITGRSLSGKTTLARCLEQSGDFQEIISHTTRAPRVGELVGKDYHFVSDKEFDKTPIVGGTVMGQVRYGTSEKELMKVIHSGKIPFAVVDPNGVQAFEDWCANNDARLIKVYRYVTEYVQLARWFHRATANSDNLRQHIKRLQTMRREEDEWPVTNQWNYVTLHGGPEGMKANINGIRKMCGLDSYFGSFDSSLFMEAPE
jgi:guanylate kinase